MSWLRRSWRRLQAGPKFDLPYILARANPEGSLAERVEFCERLFDWIRYTGGGKTTPQARIRFLLQLLERKEEWKTSSAETIRSILCETSAYQLFYVTGVPHGGTFIRELIARMTHIALPVSEDTPELASILERVFYDVGDADWVEAIPPEVWKEILEDWLFPNPFPLPNMEQELANAALALSVQGAALALRSEFASRSPEFGLEAHPFLHLEANLAALSAQTRRDTKVRERAEVLEAFNAVQNEIERARAQIRSVRTHLEEWGVSVDLVYQMDRMKLYLERIDFLAGTLTAALVEPKELRTRAVSLFRNLVAGLRYDGDFGFVFKKSLRLLSTKIVERTGNSGEHYFTANWKEWRHLFFAAAGGGVLTAFTAMFKSFGPLDPPFIAFLYAGLNYSISFSVMHFLGLKLATKQPSMTAAALAGRLTESENPEHEGEGVEFTEEVARISRAQFAAVMGNLLFVVPAVIFIELVWRGLHRQSFYSPTKAAAAIDSISLLHSGVLAYAALTGVILWISSVGAGFAENFVVYIRAQEILGGHRVLKQFLGVDRARRFGEFVVKHTVGVTSSFILGFLLAGTPILGDFFGLPLDVRHVTLTTGTLTFSFLGLNSFHGSGLAVFTVLLIGALNFGVSFSFAIMVALRARGANLMRAAVLFRASRRAFFSRPGYFFFPPKESA